MTERSAAASSRWGTSTRRYGTALANRRGYLPVPPVPRVTRIGAKMERGLCADTSIERAELLRTDYQQYWRDRGSGDPLRAWPRPGSAGSFTALATRPRMR